MTMTVKKTRFDHERSNQARLSRVDVSLRFEKLFLDHWSNVYGTLLRLVGDPSEAEDLALETFIRLYQRSPLSKAGGSEENSFNAGGWLRRVATRLGLNALRGGNRREQYELQAGEEALSYHAPDNPAELFAAQEQRWRVRRTLGDMDQRKAQLLVLRYSGLSYQEIAEVIDVAPTSIGPLLFRAEKDFARRYRAMNPEEADDAPE
jgi:RNA polymerase sigma-70 factor (ECF subfamily)